MQGRRAVREQQIWFGANVVLIENGFIYSPETALRLAENLHEVTVFPNGMDDDHADSTTQFLDWSKRSFPGQTAYELMRMEAEAAAQPRKPQPAPPNPAPGWMEWQALQEN